MEETKLCPVCGAALQQGSRFCTECGTRTDEIESAPAPAAAETEETVQAAEALPAAEGPYAPPEAPEAPDAAAAAAAAALEAETVFQAAFAEPESPEEVSPEKPELPYAPAAPVQPPAPACAPAPSTTAAAAAPFAPSAPENPAPAYAPAPPVYAPAPAEDPDRPGRKSKYAPMTSVGMALELFLMSIPVVGLILMILWSCGACRKIARRNLARACLILLILGIVAAIVGALLIRFVFQSEFTDLFERLVPGYTIQWG